MGRFITHSPEGPDHGITSDSDQPTADGPVGRFITHSPVGPDSITSACDPDRPVADGPVGQSFIAGPVGPRRMISPYELNQPVTVGPEDQPFTSGGTHEGEPDCKRTDQISESPKYWIGLNRQKVPVGNDPKSQKFGVISQSDEIRHSKRAGELGRHSPFERFGCAQFGGTVGKYEYKFYRYGIGTVQ